MGLLGMMTGRRGVKSMAMMGAAGWAMNRMTGRRGFGGRAMRGIGTASWAVPLGMMAYRHLKGRRS